MKLQTPPLHRRPRKQWTKARARRLLAALSVSQESIAAFCRRHRTTRQRLAYWRARMPRNDAASGFTQLVPASTPISHLSIAVSNPSTHLIRPMEKELRLSLGAGVDIHVTSASDLLLLRRVVEALT